jgi:hypothetical protein
VDADCGSQGYCSPSTYACGKDWGFYELRCHKPSDECIDDADCSNFDGGPGTWGDSAFCAYDDSRGHWACFRRNNICIDS